MSAVNNGAQGASGSSEPMANPSHPHSLARARTQPSRTSRLRAPGLALIMLATLLATGAHQPMTARAASDYLLMPRSELLALPTSGTAWSALKSVADASLGSANLCDINEDHHLRTLAAALVYARTGVASYGTKARAGVMAAIPSLLPKPGCDQAVLAVGRQLTAYVLAADFAGLSGADDTAFRTWLSAIRTKDLGGHAVWFSLTGTHKDSANNWGAHAGASRIAASLYLGDTADVAAAAKVTQGFLGNRSAYAGFGDRLDSTDLSWSCDGASSYTPLNRSCTKNGIDIDGGILADISRSGSLSWPPGSTAISYQSDSIQAMALQVELLSRNGYGSAWDWSNAALRRAAQLVVRSKRDGGDGWNETNASSQVPWLLNRRFGDFLPTRHSAMGRGIGFADWLWGSAPIAALPVPVTSAPTVRLSTTSSVPMSGVPVVVGWSLTSTSDGVGRYDLQKQVDGGSWSDIKLSSSAATAYWVTLGTSTTYAFRVRAVDRAGRIGDWKAVGATSGWRVSDSSSYLGWTGTWSTASSSKYLDGKLHRSTATDSDVSFTFTGSSIGWVSPVSSSHGKAQVFIDGAYERTVDLYASSSASRRMVFAKSFGEGRHTIRISVVGTSGHPAVSVDGLYVVHQ